MSLKISAFATASASQSSGQFSNTVSAISPAESVCLKRNSFVFPLTSISLRFILSAGMFFDDILPLSARRAGIVKWCVAAVWLTAGLFVVSPAAAGARCSRLTATFLAGGASPTHPVSAYFFGTLSLARASEKATQERMLVQFRRCSGDCVRFYFPLPEPLCLRWMDLLFLFPPVEGDA